MNRNKIEKEYFYWMYDLVSKNRYDNSISFRKLLSYLHNVEFKYHIKNDSDRAHDGVNLRHRFALCHSNYPYDYVIECLEGPCSVLEMMVALAIRCEETIMTNPQVGDRTAQWFWRMIVSLGLGSMTDDRFDDCYVEPIVKKFLDRKYEPDGHGGLFIVRNKDLRSVPIWTQMCYFLDNKI